MPKREDKRYSISDFISGVKGSNRVDCIFNLSEKIEGRAVDISLSGLGYEIRDINDDRLKELTKSTDMYIDLVFDSESILVGVKNVWNTVTKEQSVNVCRGGLRFEIIADDVRLRLNEHIRAMRDAAED